MVLSKYQVLCVLFCNLTILTSGNNNITEAPRIGNQPKWLISVAPPFVKIKNLQRKKRILPYLNLKTVFSHKSSFLYSLQNFEMIISCRKLRSLFSLSHATNCHALDFTWCQVWPWEKWFGEENAQETTTTTENKQAKNKETEKQKQSNENRENMWTQGPITANCRLGRFVRVLGGRLISGIKKRFEMSHSSVDRNMYLIYQFSINRWNVIINRIHFNFSNKIKTATTRT